jgi:hypothetical protein
MPMFRITGEQGFVYYFYLIYLVLFGLNTMADTAIFLANTAFFAQISDEKIGGTYMTLLGNINYKL